MWTLWDNQEDVPPPPPRSSVFVMRNGRYEPQNLMPVMPRPDILDFDGFVLRRGTASGRPPVRPPDLRQASLVKSCISLRKASLHVKLPEGHTSSPKSSSGGPVELNFIFDALKPGNLSIYLRVTEVEQNDTQLGGPVQRSIQLVESSSEPAGSDGAPALRPAVAIHEFHFEKGLGQVYRSPPLDLDGFSQESLRYDVERPREIPLAVRLFADMEAEAESSSTTGEGGEEEVLEDRSIHYTYVSLQKVGGLSGESPCAGDEGLEGVDRCPWSAHVVSQKLEHYGQCFILHEVFGAGPTDRVGDASSKRPSLADQDVEGNTDCVICLSEPRDTAVLPCRHMCFCSYCAGIVRLQCDRCPVCRQRVQSLLQFKREDSRRQEAPQQAPAVNRNR